jgi:spore germination protein YaaH
MDKYGIGGVAAWRLGFEKPAVWDEIAEYLNR